MHTHKHICHWHLQLPLLSGLRAVPFPKTLRGRQIRVLKVGTSAKMGNHIYIESTVSNLLICANCKNIGSHDRLGLGLPSTSTPRGRDARFMQHWNTTAHEPGWRIRPMYPECTGYVTMSRRPKMRANPWSHIVETCWNYQWIGNALEKWCKLCYFPETSETLICSLSLLSLSGGHLL